MDIKVPRGMYVLAVSGGVDSMVLLDLLSKQPGLDLIVAHFNHGIRLDSSKDEELIIQLTKQHKLTYEIGYGKLGPTASEEVARTARYAFLSSVAKKYGAKAIITAHHQDDLIETAFINLLRGTGYKGLVAIQANTKLIRPMLAVPKVEIKRYAKLNNLTWREDETNQDDKYLRNYLRRNVLNKLSNKDREKLISNIEKVANITVELNNEIAKLSHNILKGNLIDRHLLSLLPSEVASELIAFWLRTAKAEDIDRKTIERLNAALRTARPHTKYPVKGKLLLNIGRKTAHFGTTV